MSNVQVRAVIYGIIAGGQTLMLGIKDGPMSGADWLRLTISSLVAAAIAVRALYDTAIDSPTANVTQSTIAKAMALTRARLASDVPPAGDSLSANTGGQAACADQRPAGGADTSGDGKQ